MQKDKRNSQMSSRSFSQKIWPGLPILVAFLLCLGSGKAADSANRLASNRRSNNRLATIQSVTNNSPQSSQQSNQAQQSNRGPASAPPEPAAAPMTLDPKAVTYKLPNQIVWKGQFGGPQQAVLLGDPSKPGLYIVLVKWPPHQSSHPHFHDTDRYATVLSGTWWVASGRKYDPVHMVPMPAGSFVTDLAHGVHYDGAKDDEAVIEIVGMGPLTMTPAEDK
jgi:quercetin dioxygenase-like cupin family protein